MQEVSTSCMSYQGVSNFDLLGNYLAHSSQNSIYFFSNYERCYLNPGTKLDSSCEDLKDLDYLDNKTGCRIITILSSL